MSDELSKRDDHHKNAKPEAEKPAPPSSARDEPAKPGRNRLQDFDVFAPSRHDFNLW
ncbi:hypothetical protein [Bradyrhizobium sp. USDA 10063]